ncbi:hypothetical protein L1887_21563 [Cichorium endivia]|nr:hypothetical protein L1887_21563 [Cichorium endivia]
MDVPEVNKKLLGELEEMGFPLARAMRALHYSGNSSLLDAINWIVDHEDDPEIDQMPSVPIRIEIQGSESSSLSEEVKLKAQKLRDKARTRNKEEDMKLEPRREKGKQENDMKVKRGFETLLIYVRNVVRNPDEDKFRKIRLTNPAFKERVGIFEEGVKFLELCGFERVEGGKYLILGKPDMAVLKLAGNELQSALTNPYFGLVSTQK